MNSWSPADTCPASTTISFVCVCHNRITQALLYPLEDAYHSKAQVSKGCTLIILRINITHPTHLSAIRITTIMKIIQLNFRTEFSWIIKEATISIITQIYLNPNPGDALEFSFFVDKILTNPSETEPLIDTLFIRVYFLT